MWNQGHSPPLPSTPESHLQKYWDAPRLEATYNALLKSAQNQQASACLLAVVGLTSGVWLNTLSITSLGLRMDNEVVSIAVGLCLGLSLCQPHECIHCGMAVEASEVHRLSCSSEEGNTPDMLRSTTSSRDLWTRLRSQVFLSIIMIVTIINRLTVYEHLIEIGANCET